MMLVRTPSADRPHLVVPGLDDALAQLATSFAVLGANAQMILQQPDLTLAVLPTLPEDQALVRQHATLYLNDPGLSGGIMATFQAILTIGNQIRNVAEGLLPAAKTLDTASSSSAEYAAALSQLRSGLNALQTATTALGPDTHSAALPVQACSTALAAFLRNQIADDAARFAEAEKQASQSGVLEQIRAKIAALQTHIDQLCNDIAAGATSQIIPALKFGFTIGKTIATATEAGPLALAVGFAIKDEIGEASKFADEMRKKNAELDDYIGQYEALIVSQIAAEQELSVLLTIAGHSGVFRDNLARASDAVTLVLGDIALLSNGILFLGTVDEGLGPNWFTGQLQAAIDAWGTLGEGVQQQLLLARSLGGGGVTA